MTGAWMPGTVLVHTGRAHGDEPGPPWEVRPATQFSDPRVAGVADTGDDPPRIIRCGFAHVLVCDARGAPRPGDLLTTSEVPGVAVRQGDGQQRAATVGKVVEDMPWDQAGDVVEHDGTTHVVALLGCVVQV